ncbi:MAG: thylakoid membrane photosystem I accumulation factor [Prochlorococcus sp.]|nr:thylakoid membrane photosystem I accumulation factor [Prochlorococcaceae cyanobacterium Fu_MAG_50]
MARLLTTVLSLALALLLLVAPADAARDTDSYDGNIFTIYAGNGAIVPPRLSLAEALDRQSTVVLIFYLDDSATSKDFSPVVSELQRQWDKEIDLLPLTTDELQWKPSEDPREPASYWHGRIPQVVVIDPSGTVRLDQEGQVPLQAINEAISEASGLNVPSGSTTSLTFNELNTEVSTR